MYVLLELDAYKDEAAIAPYGVQSYPNFAVLDAAGKAKIPPGRQLSDIVRAKPPLDAANALLAFQVTAAEEAGVVPPSPDVLIAQLDMLAAFGEDARRDALLAGALRSYEQDDLGAYPVLQTWQGLLLHRTMDTDNGLSILRTVAKSLTITRASDADAACLAHPLRPFVVAGNGERVGIVNGDVDAHLLSSALLMLDMFGTMPAAPDGLDVDRVKAWSANLAAVLNRPAEARPWLDAYKKLAGDGAFKSDPEMILVDGLVISAEGRDATDTRRLLTLVQLAPGESYSPLAGVLAFEAATRAGDAELAARAKTLTTDTYGTRLPKYLADRLTPPELPAGG
jgi:hypothetical protein